MQICVIGFPYNKWSCVDVWVSCLNEFFALGEFFVFVTLLGWGGNEHATGGSLGFASLTDLGSASNINIGNVFLLA